MSDRSGSAARDRQIAENIFDWSDFWTDGEFLLGYPPAERSMGIDGERILVPEFSTRIEWAWTVVEHMHQLGWNIDISTEEAGWSCAMWNTTTEVAAVGETAAEAICKVSLRAVQP